MDMKRLSDYSPALLRTAIAVVVIWFGFSQLVNAESWTRMVPDYAIAIIPVSKVAIVYMNGILELLFGTLLLLGLCTRTVSLILGLHLLHITSIVGYGAVGARDLALTLATFAIFLRGADEFCLDKYIFRKKSEFSG